VGLRAVVTSVSGASWSSLVIMDTSQSESKLDITSTASSNACSTPVGCHSDSVSEGTATSSLSDLEKSSLSVTKDCSCPGHRYAMSSSGIPVTWSNGFDEDRLDNLLGWIKNILSGTVYVIEACGGRDEVLSIDNGCITRRIREPFFVLVVFLLFLWIVACHCFSLLIISRMKSVDFWSLFRPYWILGLRILVSSVCFKGLCTDFS
jgi:hypothetical protein